MKLVITRSIILYHNYEVRICWNEKVPRNKNPSQYLFWKKLKSRSNIFTLNIFFNYSSKRGISNIPIADLNSTPQYNAI